MVDFKRKMTKAAWSREAHYAAALIRQEIQRLYTAAAQKRDATASVGGKRIAPLYWTQYAADEKRAWAEHDALSTAYHRWSGTAVGAHLDTHPTPDDAALLAAVFVLPDWQG
jgi:hypothetical protein